MPGPRGGEISAEQKGICCSQGLLRCCGPGSVQEAFSYSPLRAVRVSFPGAASSLCRTFLIQLLQLQVPRAKSLLKTSVPLFDCFLAQRLGQASLPPLLGVICSRGASGKARAWPQLHCQSCCWASIETFIPLVPPHCTEQSRQGASGCLGPRCLLPNCFWDLPLGTNRR